MIRSSLRSAFALAGAIAACALLAAPSLRSFALNGGSIGIATTGNGYQRDVRIFDDAADPTANDNATPDPSHPGALGAALAVWKATRAWSSDVATAAKNFDYDWQGAAASSPANANVLGWASCGPSGPFAFTDTAVVDGWRIVMCEEWTWSDGPGMPVGTQIDIQGVATHELGHALGLGHSSVGCGNCTSSLTATMCPGLCLTGGFNGVTERDLAPDDAAGLEAIYGAIPAQKPRITGLSGSLLAGETLVVHGESFAPTVHVKFTAATGQNTGAIPGVVYDVPTTGTQLSVTIPAAARPGNVLVWEPALGLLSNAFPIAVVASPAAPPTIASISPTSVPAFAPGSLAIRGTGSGSVCRDAIEEADEVGDRP